MEYYNIYKRDFKRLGVALDKNVIGESCFKTNKQTLQRTMIPDNTSKKKNTSVTFSFFF